MKKTIVITGGGSGLGKAIASLLAKSHQIIILSNKIDELKKASEELGCDYFSCDVSNYSECESVLNEIAKKYGKIDVLINNAGVYIQDKLTENDPEKIMPTHTHTYTYADADKPNVTQNRQTISTPNTKKMLKFICSNPVFIKNLKHQDEQLVDLLLWMTISCPKNRPTYHEILQHPYFSAISNNDIYPPITPRLSILTLQPYTINENYTNEMLCNIIKNMYNICNSICATNTYSGANISFESMILAFHLYCDNNSSNPTMCFDINKILACLSIVNNICDNISTPICSFLNYTQNISLSEFTDIKMNIIRQNNVYKVFAYLIVLNIMDENELKILKSTQYKSVILHSCCFSSKVDLYTKTMWICNQINVKVPRWISDLSESNSYKIAVNEMKIISKICHF